MTINKALAAYTDKLFALYHNRQTAYHASWWLIQKALGKSQSEILATKTPLSPETAIIIESWITLMINDHMPLQYILETVPFLSLDIRVKSPILIPRPETEYWTDILIQSLKPFSHHKLSILDICSGTGCIALALADAFTTFRLTASDINPLACALIQENCIQNGIKNCVVYESDLFNALKMSMQFSIITANPPYISYDDWENLEKSVKNWESPLALIADNNGLDLIKKIILQAPDYLEKETLGFGQLWIEIAEHQAEDVYMFFKKSGYTSIEILKDQYGKNRTLIGII